MEQAAQAVTEDFLSEITNPQITDFIIQLNTNALENETEISERILTLLPKTAKVIGLKYGSNTYQNFYFKTISPRANWEDLNISLEEMGLLDRVIAVCAGNYGWDDYHILHHPKIKVNNG